jgi:hypothetical protein
MQEGRKKLVVANPKCFRIHVVLSEAGEECRMELDADDSAGRDGK